MVVLEIVVGSVCGLEMETDDRKKRADQVNINVGSRGQLQVGYAP